MTNFTKIARITLLFLITGFAITSLGFAQINRYIISGSDDYTVRKIDSAGVQVWSYTGHTLAVNDIDLDVDGNAYSVSSDNQLHKINASGLNVWTYTGHTAAVRAVVVDADGFTYSGSDNNEIHKVDPDGNFVWSYIDIFARDIEVDDVGNVYVTDGWTLYKIDSDGELVWDISGYDAYGLALDDEGNIFLNDYHEVKKLNPQGNEIWTFLGHSDTQPVNDLDTDKDGNVYTASSDQTMRKIDPDGNEVWSYTGHTSFVQSVIVDLEGYSYSGASGSDEIHKVDPNGNQVWINTSHTNTVKGLSVQMDAGLGPVTLISPATGTTDLNVRPDFTWESLLDAVEYDILVSPSPIFSSYSIIETGITATNFSTEFDLLEGTQYYWRVRGVDANGVKGDWSDDFTFSTVTLGFTSGDGSAADPYQVSTLGQLQLIRDNSDANFILMNDIDAQGTSTWNGGSGFNPIGDDVVSFQGRFNGNGYTISNLYISRSGEFGVGLFGTVADGAFVENVNIEDVTITGGDYNVGGLAGFSDGIIRNVSVSGTISGTGDNTGGVVGVLGGLGEIRQSNASVTINSNGNRAGGLVGESSGLIESSYATQNVAGTFSSIGGLLGRAYSDSEVYNSYALGDVNATDEFSNTEYVGGLIGYNEGIVESSYARGNVTGDIYSGGLIGNSDGTNPSVSSSFATGTVSGEFAIGGLIGRNAGSVQNSYALGDVTANDDVGGLIGENLSQNVVGVFAKGDVSGTNQVGGLIGRMQQGTIVTRGYAWGDVTGEESVGGVVGVSIIESQISETYASGLVTGTTDVGGVIGLNGGTVELSYWDQEATGRGVGVGRGTGTGVTGLNTADMTGAIAADNMTDYDFTTNWQTTDTYPALSWERIGIPFLISPFDNAISVDYFPEFTWDAVEGASTYQIQVGRSSNFPQELVIDQLGLAVTTYTSTVELSPGANYSWRVRIADAEGNPGEWSDLYTFTTAATVNANNSSVIATTPHLPDGVDEATVTVRLRNDSNVSVSNFLESDFNITVTGGAVASAITETATPGTYSFGVTSSTPAAARVQVVADGVELSDEPFILFTDETPDMFLFTASEDSTVKKLDFEGNEIWSFKGDNQYGFRGLTNTPDGSIYAGTIVNGQIYKLDLNGSEITTFSLGDIEIYDIEHDSEGNIYVSSNDSNIRKLNSEGDIIWTRNFWTHDIIITPNDDIYTIGQDQLLVKLDRDGNEIWDYAISGVDNYLEAVTVDFEGNIIVGTNFGEVHKVSPDGDNIWTYTQDGIVFSVVTDSQGNVYTGGSSELNHKISPDGQQIWAEEIGGGAWVFAMTIDRDDFLYMHDYGAILKVDPENAEVIWNQNTHTWDVRDLNVGYYVETGTGSVVLNLPENEVSDVSLLPTFEWAATEGAFSYRIQVSDDPEFNTTILSANGLDEPEFSPSTELQPETTYYWRVRGADALGIEGSWSPAYTFTTISTDQVYSRLVPELGIANPNAPLELRFNFLIEAASMLNAVSITDSEGTDYSFTISEPSASRFLLTPTDGFFAGDEITVSITSSLLVSTSGFDITGNDTTFTYSTSFLGDFGGDGGVDAEDLVELASRWRMTSSDEDISAYDIGPATGTPPRMKSNPDGVLDFEDLIIFAFNWNRSIDAAKENGSLTASLVEEIAPDEWTDFRSDFIQKSGLNISEDDQEAPITFRLNNEYAELQRRIELNYDRVSGRENERNAERVELLVPGRSDQYKSMDESSADNKELALVLSEAEVLKGYELIVTLPEGVSMDDVIIRSPYEKYDGQTFALNQVSDHGFVLNAANLGSPLNLSKGDTLATFMVNSPDLDVVDVTVAYSLYQGNNEVYRSMYGKMTDVPAEIPDQFQVLQNFPNPFNPSTEIRYQLPERADVRIRIYDIIGRLVYTVADQQVEAGFYQVNWDASRFASGIYLYVIQARGASGQTYMQTKKMTLIK